MGPEWRYIEEKEGRYFVVYADAKGSCSRRRFHAGDGTFVDETPGPGQNYAELFRSDMKNSVRLGELNGRPNLENAVRQGKLPGDVLGELKSLVRSIGGVKI